MDIGGDTGDWEHDRRTVSRAELIGIMRPRVEEILEEVRARLDAAGFDHLPSQQIVLTGGGSQIPGLDGLASKILGQQVRLGRPLRVHGLPTLVEHLDPAQYELRLGALYQAGESATAALIEGIGEQVDKTASVRAEFGVARQRGRVQQHAGTAARPDWRRL